MISWERHLLVSTLSVCVGGRRCVGALPAAAAAAALLTDPDHSDVALQALYGGGASCVWPCTACRSLRQINHFITSKAPKLTGSCRTGCENKSDGSTTNCPPLYFIGQWLDLLFCFFLFGLPTKKCQHPTNRFTCDGGNLVWNLSIYLKSKSAS